MAASWRQRNLRSRWRVRQYKETTWERLGRHPRHQPMNWCDSIQVSDNRTPRDIPKACKLYAASSEPMKENVSVYVCNHSSLRMISSFEGRFGNASSVTDYLKHDYKHPMHLTLAGGRLWRKLMSVCEHKRAPVEHIILLFPRGTNRNARSMAKRRSVSFPFSGNYGYISNLRRSLLKGTLHCVLFRGSLWERYANAAMLREKCPKAGFLSHRLEEHHPCSAELGSTIKTLLQASSKLAITD